MKCIHSVCICDHYFIVSISSVPWHIRGPAERACSYRTHYFFSLAAFGQWPCSTLQPYFLILQFGSCVDMNTYQFSQGQWWRIQHKCPPKFSRLVISFCQPRSCQHEEMWFPYISRNCLLPPPHTHTKGRKIKLTYDGDKWSIEAKKKTLGDGSGFKVCLLSVGSWLNSSFACYNLVCIPTCFVCC